MEEIKGFSLTNIVSNRIINLNPAYKIFELELDWPKDFTYPFPGQFVRLKVRDEILPRPFSVAFKKDGSILLYIKAVGKITDILSRLEPGEALEMQGPLGKPFFSAEPATGYILVGGGMGAALILRYAQKFDRIGQLTFTLIGVNDVSDFPGYMFRKLDCGLEVITDKDGTAADLLERNIKHIKENRNLKNLNYIIISCGPLLMMEKVAKIAKENKMKCYVSLEEMMACGVGSCKGCPVFCKGNIVKQVCHDGPIFDANEVDWEKIIPKFQKAPTMKYQETDNPSLVTLISKSGEKHRILPVMNGSGCLDIEGIEEGYHDISQVDVLITKGTSYHPILGNPPPRICEAENGMINAIGMQNPGVKVFKKFKLPRWIKTGKKIIINIFGCTVKEYGMIVEELDDTDIFGYEVNISCPNVNKGGMLFGQNVSITKRVISVVKKRTKKIIFAKIPPQIANHVEISRAAYEAGADYIVAINTIPSMMIDIKTRRPKIARVYGGYSGPAIFPIALGIVNKIYEAGISVIGVGGIHDEETTISMRLGGAVAVQIGSGNFRDRSAMTKSFIWQDKYWQSQGFSCADEMTGNLIKQII